MMTCTGYLAGQNTTLYLNQSEFYLNSVIYAFQLHFYGFYWESIETKFYYGSPDNTIEENIFVDDFSSCFQLTVMTLFISWFSCCSTTSSVISFTMHHIHGSALNFNIES